MQPKLYLIPNLLEDTDVDICIPSKNLEIIRQLKHFIVETPKVARVLLKKAGVKTPFDDIAFYILNEHTTSKEVQELIKPLLAGENMGLISDAGYPVIADPGESLVKLAHQKNIKIVPLPGSSSIFMALAASGLNAEQFTFHGYIPVRNPERQIKLKVIEEISSKTGYTQIFMEAPYRSQALFEDILMACHPTTLLCLAINITAVDESIETRNIQAWKQNKPLLNKRKCIFVLGRY
jgi:16S rRNA (cytidine1402-2'-O)-methyltransferase